MKNSKSVQINNVGGNVGTYAISTIDFDSWMNEPTTQTKSKGRKGKDTKEVTNKIFTECSQLITDPFWREKFTAASFGKFPRGFSYQDGLLCHKKATKCKTLEVPTNPIEAAYACVDFFRTNGCIFSPLDKQTTLELKFQRAQTSPQEPLTWGTANKKMQQCLLNKYITDMKNVMSLSNKESENLRQTVRSGITNKILTKAHITVEKNKIYSIDGLLWDEESRMFYINPELKPQVSRSYNRKKDNSMIIDATQKDSVPLFNVKWAKYTEYLNKIFIQFSKNQKNAVVISANSHLRLFLSDASASTRTDISSTDGNDDTYSDDDDYINSEDDA